MKTANLVVMISGTGTNLQALIDAAENGRLPAQIGLVVGNRKEAYGLTRAREADIPTLYFPLQPYREAGKSRETYDADLAVQITSYQPDLIVLAGWMHILSPAFLEQFPKQVINLHPALPGQFPGTDAIRRAYDAFQEGEIEKSGCMIHYAIPEVDAGEVITAVPVPIQENDALDDFAARMHAAEHELIIVATDRALMRRWGITVDNVRARIEAAWAKWNGLLAEIPPARRTEPGLPGGWAVKDVMAHLSWFEREMVGLIRERALAGSELWNMSQAERNAAIYEQNLERPLAQVQKEADEIHADLAAAVTTLSDEELQDASHFDKMPPQWRPWEVLAGNSYEHYLDHIPPIRRWLAG